MGSTAKELEALWERNKAKRKAALSKDASPKLPQSLPPQLQTPVKVRGFARPKGLRGPALVKLLMLLAIAWQDKRYTLVEVGERKVVPMHRVP